MLLRFAFFSVLLQPAAFAQQPPSFEVAVIRPSAAAVNAGTSLNLLEGGRLKIVNEPVKLLLRLAFQLQNAQITGAPAWVEHDRYDIEAKTGGPQRIAPGEVSGLIQALLLDRFQLKFHRETREIAAYALIPAKGGAKLKRAAASEPSSANATSARTNVQLVATATTLDQLAGYVANRLGKILVDKTGLPGGYDFTLTWSNEADGADSSLVTALTEQLGLKLIPQKLPVEVLIIDRIERPSPN